MYSWPPRALTALALILSAQSAAALTPEEAWAGWQALGSTSGQTITATGTARAGDTLTVSGITVAAGQADTMAVAVAIASVDFKDRGDGTVEITYPPSYDATLTFGPEMRDGPKSFVLAIAQDQLAVIASGSAEAPKYDYTAATITATAKDFVRQDGAAADVNGVLTLTGLSGSYAAAPAGSAKALDSNFAAKTLGLTVTGSIPDASKTFSANLSTSDIAFKGATVMVDPALLEAGNMSAALAAGFRVDGGGTTGPVKLVVDAKDHDTPNHLDLTLTGTEVHVLMDAARLDYGFGLNGGTVKATGFDMPFPEVASAFGEIGLGFAMPVNRAKNMLEDFQAGRKFGRPWLGADVVALAVDGRERTVVGRRRMSTWSEDSVLSVMSIRSIGSVGSALSFFSAGSLLSACSAGSILSISSAGSILSINSAGSILCINADGAIGVFRRRRPEHTCGPQCGHHGQGHLGTDLAGAADQGAPAS